MKILTSIFVIALLFLSGCVSQPEYFPRQVINPPVTKVYYAGSPYYPYYPYYNARPYYHSPSYPFVTWRLDVGYVYSSGHRSHHHRHR